MVRLDECLPFPKPTATRPAPTISCRQILIARRLRRWIDADEDNDARIAARMRRSCGPERGRPGVP
jgi:hypothetical protein